MLQRFPEYLQMLIRISGSHLIARRYFIVNGFDGALAMMGLLMGFYHNRDVQLNVIIGACTGTAIALAMSGISSAYISETAEKQQELKALEDAMITDLKDTAFGHASRFMPLVIALVNGISPLLFALIIMSPLMFYSDMNNASYNPVEVALAVALVLIFLLGIYIGRISGSFWLWAGLRSIMIALVTIFAIWLVSLYGNG